MRQITLLLSVLVGLVAAGPARAAISAAIDTTPANLNFVQNLSAAQNGSLDVFLTKDAVAYNVASYNARVDSSLAGIVLTGAGAASAAHPPLFPTVPTVSGTSTPTSLRLTDALPSGQTAVANGSGLFSIKFTIPAGVVGDFPLLINPAGTFLFDGSGSPVAFTSPPTGATIHIAPVPEPAAATLACAVAALGLRRGRSRRA